MLPTPMLDPTPAARELVRRTGASAVGYAPARANLIGEHLDYNGGPSLPIALPYWTHVAVRAGRAPGLRLTSDARPPLNDDLHAGALRTRRGDWTDYPVGVLTAMIEAGDLPGLPDGLELTITSTVPAGSGLSSSASLTVATASALWALVHGAADLPRERLLSAALAAENDFVSAPTGALDQTAVLYAHEREALFFRPGAVDPARTGHIPWDPGSFGAHLLVVDSRVRHSHLQGGYGARVAECRAAAAELGVTSLASLRPEERPWERATDPRLVRRIRHVVSETARTEQFAQAARHGEMIDAGRLMTESHRSLRDDYEVSCPELDLIVDTAVSGGALGARMTGGGFGGCAVVLVDQASPLRVTASISQAFAAAGWEAPVFLDGTAVGPAGVVLDV